MPMDSFALMKFPLLKPILEKKADFVTGNRFPKGATRPKNMAWIKYWGNKRMSKLISRLSGEQIEDAACGFRAYSRETLLHLNLMGNFTYTQETILDLCHKEFRLAQVPITCNIFQIVLHVSPEAFFDTQSNHSSLYFEHIGIIIRFVFSDTLLFSKWELVSFRNYSSLPLFFIGSFTPYKFLGFCRTRIFSLWYYSFSCRYFCRYAR